MEPDPGGRTASPGTSTSLWTWLRVLGQAGRSRQQRRWGRNLGERFRTAWPSVLHLRATRARAGEDRSSAQPVRPPPFRRRRTAKANSTLGRVQAPDNASALPIGREGASPPVPPEPDQDKPRAGPTHTRPPATRGARYAGRTRSRPYRPPSGPTGPPAPTPTSNPQPTTKSPGHWGRTGSPAGRQLDSCAPERAAGARLPGSRRTPAHDRLRLTAARPSPRRARASPGSASGTSAPGGARRREPFRAPTLPGTSGEQSPVSFGYPRRSQASTRRTADPDPAGSIRSSTTPRRTSAGAG